MTNSRKNRVKSNTWLSLLLSLALFLTSQPLLSGSADAASRGFSAIAVDAHTGKVLVARDADAPRYPASITKVMTLYLLFEDMRQGRFNKKSRFKVSSKASRQPPSKLNLKPGETISVDDAIKALVTRSANDVAMVVAENVGGSEAAFAARMNATAKKLGMTRTSFRNPSGLPNKAQISTARDIATLSLRIQRDFPEYYGYFKIPSFVFKGQKIATHNKLLGRFNGTDGIKTGYIGASGYNLTTSAARGNKRLIGVVLGAPSGGARNRYMMQMLEPLFAKASSGNKIALLAGNPPGYESAKKAEVAQAPVPKPPQPEAEEILFAMAKSAPELQKIAVPLPRKKPPVPTILEARLEDPEDAPEVPQSEPGDEAENQDDGSDEPATTFTAVIVEQPQDEDIAAMVSSEPVLQREDTKAIFADGEPAWPQSTNHMTADFRSFKPLQTASTTAIAVPEPTIEQAVPPILPEPAPREDIETLSAGDSWMVQIGSWIQERDAKRRLDKAAGLNIDALDGKTPMTLQVKQKGKQVYTARFAGFSNEKEAKSACRQLSRKGIGCVSLAPGQSG